MNISNHSEKEKRHYGETREGKIRAMKSELSFAAIFGRQMNMTQKTNP